MGSYVLELSGAGMSARAVPLRVGRQESIRVRLRLFPDPVVGEDFVHVSGGACRLGGDPLAQLATPSATVEVSDFFIARRPVTSEAWFDYLLDIARTEGPGAAQARVPRSGPNRPLWPLADDGAPETVPDRDSEGRPWHAGWSVVCVSCEDAEAYCEWLTHQTGVRHRLPTEREWEKAARGVDGRLFPWGDAWAATFCHMGISRDGPPGPGPVGAFPADTSPYGVLDMAGGVSEWTASWLDEGQRQRVVKGGHWASGPTECRSASRFTQPPHRVSPTLGFRVVREAPK
jgi:serine/threonine-protein kinase